MLGGCVIACCRVCGNGIGIFHLDHAVQPVAAADHAVEDFLKSPWHLRGLSQEWGHCGSFKVAEPWVRYLLFREVS